MQPPIMEEEEPPMRHGMRMTETNDGDEKL